MRNLFLTLLSLTSIGVFAQEELVRLQIGFHKSTPMENLSWEVWAEPAEHCGCWDMSKPFSEKPWITEDFISAEIEENKIQTDSAEGNFLLWFSVFEHGIYHIQVKDKTTGELVGHTIVRIDGFALAMLDKHGDIGFVCYPHEWRFVQIMFTDRRATWWGGGCYSETYYPSVSPW